MPDAFRLKHRHHHQVARAERAIEPVGTPEATGKLAQPVADAILDQRHALPHRNACFRPVAAGRISTKLPFARSIYYFVVAPQDQTQLLAGKGRGRNITTQ